MNEIQTTRIGLPTGVTLKLVLGGEGEAILFLHGFPESHRTWRHQLVSLAPDFRVIAPDQRGYGGSDKPPAVGDYKIRELRGDVMALADALDLDRFTLVGHDWGGAVAWNIALKYPERIARLVILNAPHPYIYQRSLIEDPDQRAASQYIRQLRSRGSEEAIAAMGYEDFLERAIGGEADLRKLSHAERQIYLDDWAKPGAMAAMINWYRASPIVVPPVGRKAPLPQWTDAPFPKVKVPTLLVWGLADKTLLPVQIAGLPDLVEDLQMVTDPGAGHFITWERPELVTRAIRDFMMD